MKELLDCSFCGTKGQLIHRGTNNPMDNNWTVGCQTEECFIGNDGADFYLPKTLAIKWWNKRTNKE